MIGRYDFETGKGTRLVVVETIGTERGHEVHDEVVDGAVTRVDERLGILQRVVDALDNIAFVQHFFAISEKSCTFAASNSQGFRAAGARQDI